MSEFLKIDVPGGLILTPATARGASKKFLIHHLEARTRYSTPESDMNFLAIPEAEWIVLHPEFDAAGDPIPPTPRLPAFPAPLANNANAASGIICSRAYNAAETA
jgi:hypothetical protein